MSVTGWCFGCGGEVGWEGCDQHHVPLSPGPPLDDERWGGCGPVWPMVRVRTQREAEELIPKLLEIDALGHVVEWVPGEGRIDFTNEEGDDDWNWLTGEHYDWPDGTPRQLPSVRSICWVRIAADPDGEPVDIGHVRAVVDQARDVGVPVWIERLGSVVSVTDPKITQWPKGTSFWREDSDGCAHIYQVSFRSYDGCNPLEWPEDLRRRELPEVVT